MIRKLLRSWLGVDAIEDAANDAVLDHILKFRTELEADGVSLRNVINRVVAAELSLRLVEDRLGKIEALAISRDAPVNPATIGQLTKELAALSDQLNRDRLDASAAALRGLSIEEYRAQVAERKRQKAERSANGANGDTA